MIPKNSRHSHCNGNDCSRKEGYNLTEPEVTEAIKLLDKNGDKLIQFSEFVEWWQDKVSLLLSISLVSFSNCKAWLFELQISVLANFVCIS